MFSKRLKSIREKKGISQNELASFLELSRPTITKYERGEREPDFVTLQKLADFFDVSVDYILGRTDDPKGNNDLDPDLRMISRAAHKMNPKKREKMLELLKISFEEEFEDDE